MDPKKLSIRLSAKGKKEEKAGKEDRRLAPMMRALKAIHSVGAPDSMNPEDLAKQRAGQELLGRLAAPMIVMKKWEPFSLKGMAAAWVKPDWPHDRRRVILYCHGGGYTSGNLGYSRPLASKLTNATGWETLCFEYRLAPEHPFPAAVDDARKAWDYLQAVREVYAGGRDLTSPMLSPLFGNFEGFPPTLIQVGSNEILFSDSLRLRERMQTAKVHCQLEVWNDMWHVFQMFPVRKAALAMERIGNFLLEQ